MGRFYDAVAGRGDVGGAAVAVARCRHGVSLQQGFALDVVTSLVALLRSCCRRRRHKCRLQMSVLCLSKVSLERRELHAPAGASLGFHCGAEALPKSSRPALCERRSQIARSYDSASSSVWSIFRVSNPPPTPSPRATFYKTTYGSYPAPLFSYAASAARNAPSVKPSFNRRAATSAF